MESEQQRPQFIYGVRTITRESRERPEIRVKLTNAIASTNHGNLKPAFPDVFERTMLALCPLVETNGTKYLSPSMMTGKVHLDVTCGEKELTVVASLAWWDAIPLARATISLCDFTVTCVDPALETTPAKNESIKDATEEADWRTALLLYSALNRPIVYMPSMPAPQRLNPLQLPRRHGYPLIFCATPMSNPTEHPFLSFLESHDDTMVTHVRLAQVGKKLFEWTLPRNAGENAPQSGEKTQLNEKDARVAPVAKQIGPMLEKIEQLEDRVAALERLNKDRFESMQSYVERIHYFIRTPTAETGTNFVR